MRLPPPPPPGQLLSVGRAYRPVPAATAAGGPGGGGPLWFASDMAGVTQVYRLAGPDRFPVRLAPGQDRMLPVAATPFGLLVRHDQGGNETWQLALIEGEAGGGAPRPLTHDPRAIHRDLVLSPDGRRVGLSFNPGGQSDWVLGVLDLETGEIERWLEAGGIWNWLAWSPDGATAAVVEDVPGRARQNRAYLLQRGQPPRQVLEGAPMVAGLDWTATGRLLAVTDLDRDFLGLVEVGPGGEVARRLVDEAHDVLAANPDSTGRRAAIVVNEGAYDSIRVLDLETGASDPSWSAGLAPGVVYADGLSRTPDHVAWAPGGESLYVAWESSTAPAEVFQLPGATRWTRASGDPIPGLTVPEQVSYRSFDGLDIPALHYRVDGTPRTTVVYFHGGPAGQSRANYLPHLAVWNAAGIDVLAPNVRGSTGYGRRYAALDDRELRWDAVRDGCEAGRWLREQGLATDLVAMGVSYGGFMTLAVLVEQPELWDAAVDIVGVTDWHSFFANTSGWRRANRAAEYGDPDGPDGEFLAEFSPLRRAHRITAPLLVIHGRNDVRVPLGEALQIHEAAATSELLVFDDEGHGIVKHGNRATAYGRAVQFVRERINP